MAADAQAGQVTQVLHLPVDQKIDPHELIKAESMVSSQVL